MRLDEQGCENSVIIFALQPFLPKDFEPLCQALLDNPESCFRNVRIVNLRTGDGYRRIRDHVLTICSQAGKTENTFTDEELPDILQEWFHLPASV